MQKGEEGVMNEYHVLIKDPRTMDKIRRGNERILSIVPENEIWNLKKSNLNMRGGRGEGNAYIDEWMNERARPKPNLTQYDKVNDIQILVGT